MATHSLKDTFDKSGPQNQWWRYCDVISQSISTKFCIFICYTKRHLCAKFEQNRTRKKKLQKMGNDIIVTSFLKTAQQYFMCGYFFTHTYSCTKFQVDWRSDKGITGGGTKQPPPPPGAENDQLQKKPGQNRVKISQIANFFIYIDVTTILHVVH